MSSHPSAPWIPGLFSLQLLSRLAAEIFPGEIRFISVLNILNSACWSLLVLYLLLRLACEQSCSWWLLDYCPKVSLALKGTLSWIEHCLMVLMSRRWLPNHLNQQLFPLPSSLISSICTCLGQFYEHFVHFRAETGTTMFFRKENRECEELFSVPEQQEMDRFEGDYCDDSLGLEMTGSVHEKHA